MSNRDPGVPNLPARLPRKRPGRATRRRRCTATRETPHKTTPKTFSRSLSRTGSSLLRRRSPVTARGQVLVRKSQQRGRGSTPRSAGHHSRRIALLIRRSRRNLVDALVADQIIHHLGVAGGAVDPLRRRSAIPFCRCPRRTPRCRFATRSGRTAHRRGQSEMNDLPCDRRWGISRSSWVLRAEQVPAVARNITKHNHAAIRLYPWRRDNLRIRRTNARQGGVEVVDPEEESDSTRYLFPNDGLL